MTLIYISQDLTINWSTSNATSCTASGDWSGTKALSGTETLSFTSAGQKSFTLTCQNSEGNETSRTVTSNVIGNAQGIVVGINGISSANVVLDINSNYAIDDGEPSSTSDGSGIYELPDDPQDMISFGGGDDLSGKSGQPDQCAGRFRSGSRAARLRVRWGGPCAADRHR